jgi:probable rRNA maturation factor
MLNINISNLQKKLPIPEIRIKKLIHKILKGENFKGQGYINVCFTDNSLIKKLNTRFLKTAEATDVLAFNLSGKTATAILADIAISAESAINNARYFKTSPKGELMLYVAHGVLHILGFNDHTKNQIQLMRKKEKKYVNR